MHWKREMLAIDGGTPAVTSPIPDWPPHWPTVADSVAQSLSDGTWGKYHGRSLDELRASISRFVGVDHVWPCASGTIAVELALRGIGVTESHEVILSGYDFPGNFRAVESIGARPVLVDVQPGSVVLNPDNITAAITDKTKAIVASHLHGQLADINTIRQISNVDRSNGSIAIVEDACQVPGAIIHGMAAGSHGDVGVFSFGGSKLLTAGRGGAVVTGNDQIMQRIRISAERGNDAFPLSALQAAALSPQLDLISEANTTRNINAAKIHAAVQAMSVCQNLQTGQVDTAQKTAWFKYPIFCGHNVSRDRLIDVMVAEGLPAAEGFRGFAKRSRRRCDKIGELSNSNRAAESLILLHHPLLLGDDELLRQTVIALSKIDKHLSANL